MSTPHKKWSGSGAKGAPERKRTHGLRLAAIGLEAEFAVFVDDRQVRPEDVFGDPRAFVRAPLVHRKGTSYHLPTGDAVYFDTGVIEVATPIIEIEEGCAARAGRSLWESILFVRGELDAWERRHGRNVRLVGFSTHYNISFDVPPAQQGDSRNVEKLAYLLAHILPAPVMLLATNKRSTGVGVRPRGDRIEVTVDFTPSASLMIATGAFITGVAREVMKWPSFEMETLESAGLPIMADLHPMPHTSRHGWLARADCYPQNPFTTPPDEPVWRIRSGVPERHAEKWPGRRGGVVFRGIHRGQPPPQRRRSTYRPLEGAPRWPASGWGCQDVSRSHTTPSHEILSLREIAQRTFHHFRLGIRRIAEPFTFRLIGAVLSGRAPSLLDLPDRPEEYEDVGRLCLWDDLFPERVLSRSRYERILIRAISGQKLWIGGWCFTPVGLRGWSEVVFSRDADRSRHTFPIDYLLDHLDRWG
ncbi:MAG TPA: hypothetical protein VFG50_05220 [Rhodothermales bacterium]|nr:hypothetical protein [Rhodothermales bacterium]